VSTFIRQYSRYSKHKATYTHIPHTHTHTHTPIKNNKTLAYNRLSARAAKCLSTHIFKRYTLSLLPRRYVDKSFMYSSFNLKHWKTLNKVAFLLRSVRQKYCSFLSTKICIISHLPTPQIKPLTNGLRTCATKLQLERHSESANLRKRYVNFSVVFARWQHYIGRRFALSGNGKESFNSGLDQDADPDNRQNLTTSKFGQV